MKKILILLIIASFNIQANAESPWLPNKNIRIIIDNDFGGDIDGAFALVHHLLSPSVDVRGIICSHLTTWKGINDNDTNVVKSIPHGMNLARKIVHFLGQNVPVISGADLPMVKTDSPKCSEGANFIIKEALRSDIQTPLFIVCGGSLTDIASAWLQKPEIANKITLIWIGGQEYKGIALPPPNFPFIEFNLSLDTIAAKTIFNFSNIPLWQVPRDAYRQCLMSRAEIEDLKSYNTLGRLMANMLENAITPNMGETYDLGDSPLVLLTALQSAYQPDASSSKYRVIHAPNIRDNGTYENNPKGRNIRVYTQLDTRLLFHDMVLKIKQFRL
jgi:inosine-uridine nucleoside N-ribohydrolase